MIPTILYRIIKSDSDYDKILKLREDVFIKEQGVPRDLEYDEFDKDAIHYGGFSKDEAVACGRILICGDSAKIGRVAVKKDLRKSGIGIELCTGMIDIAKSKNVKTIHIDAQTRAKPFYEKLGFVPTGNEFYEAGIMHIKMTLALEVYP